MEKENPYQTIARLSSSQPMIAQASTVWMMYRNDYLSMDHLLMNFYVHSNFYGSMTIIMVMVIAV
jgi:hypothetical protein